MENISQHVRRLVDYAVARGLCGEDDRTFMTNRILSLLGASEYIESESEPALPLEGMATNIHIMDINIHFIAQKLIGILQLCRILMRGLHILMANLYDSKLGATILLSQME